MLVIRKIGSNYVGMYVNTPILCYLNILILKIRSDGVDSNMSRSERSD